MISVLLDVAGAVLKVDVVNAVRPVLQHHAAVLAVERVHRGVYGTADL